VVSFTPSSALVGEPAFLSEDVINGVDPNPALRNQPGWVWVEVENHAECIRLYGKSLGCRDTVPLIFLEGDVISSKRSEALHTTHRSGAASPAQQRYFPTLGSIPDGVRDLLAAHVSNSRG
jgi:hypothetical protein